MSECGACGGDGRCHNDFHNFYDGIIDTMTDSGGSCPACGEDPATPGKCSSCGGEGSPDDD